MPHKILVDSCFWFALYSKRDQYHDQAIASLQFIETNQVLVPWPSMYETLNTKFISNKNANLAFINYLKKGTTITIDDSPYRSVAEKTILDFKNLTNLSLVDLIIREMLFDKSLRIDYFITYDSVLAYEIQGKTRIKLLSKN